MLWNIRLRSLDVWERGGESQHLKRLVLATWGWYASAQSMKTHFPQEREAEAAILPNGSPAFGTPPDIKAELPPSCDKFPAEEEKSRI